ncbi:MAG: hypothetical protein K9N51_13175 [Candidatus Pacebacteria bacterium]|nr:hypothetical protein [Candidatus Paceibacterota bacterium]
MSPETASKSEEIREFLRQDYDVRGDDLDYLNHCLRANIQELCSSLRQDIRTGDWADAAAKSQALHSLAANMEWGELRRAAAALRQCAEHKSREMTRRVLMKIHQILKPLD